MSKLLRFLVSHRLSETHQLLKGYTIAVDALGRADNFDAHIDSYPRVQIGRLRRMLDHFYLRNGGDNRLLIPYNHYEVLLVSNGVISSNGATEDSPTLIGETDKAPSTDRSTISVTFRSQKWSWSRRQILIVLMTAMLLIAAASFVLMRSGQSREIGYPAIIVMEPKGMADASAGGRANAARAYVVGAMSKFDQVKVYEAKASETSGSEYLLEFVILDEAGSSIQIRLTDKSTSEIIWSDRVEMIDPARLEDGLGKWVIAIAGPYGAIARNELKRYGDDHAVGYPCLLQFHQYLRYREQDALNPVLECVGKSGRMFPDDAYMLSMLAVAKDISARIDSSHKIEESSKDIAQRAAKLDSQSGAAAFAVAQSAFYEGNCRKGVEWGERAVELNPLNSRVVGYLGLYMLGCKLPEGERYTARALEMDPSTDMVVAATLAFQMLQRGDAKSAQALSLKYMMKAEKVEPGLELTYILSTAMLGDKREARRAWRRLAVRYRLPETATPQQVMHRWIANPAVLREVNLAFDKAELY